MKLWNITEAHGGALFISGKPKSTPAEKRTRDVKKLRDAGISHIVSLIPVGSAWLADEGFTYHQYTVKDGTSEGGINPESALEAANFVVGLLALDRRVLVHCHVGKNRSGVVATLVMVTIAGLQHSGALTYVRERRPGAVSNPRWERWLLEGT